MGDSVIGAAFGGGILGALFMGGATLVRSEVKHAQGDLSKKLDIANGHVLTRVQVAHILLLIDVAEGTGRRAAHDLVAKAGELLIALESNRLLLEDTVRAPGSSLALRNSRALAAETVLLVAARLYDVLSALRAELAGAHCTAGQRAITHAIDAMWARCSRVSEIAHTHA